MPVISHELLITAIEMVCYFCTAIAVAFAYLFATRSSVRPAGSDRIAHHLGDRFMSFTLVGAVLPCELRCTLN